ncbi:MAG: hypothetical protein ACE5KE_06475, partial [Methanosarcinales archaeon]
IDDYFWGSGFESHWDYIYRDEKRYIEIEGKEVWGRLHRNVNFLFDYFLKNGKGIGISGDEYALANTFNRSWGIADTFVLGETPDPGFTLSHSFMVYFDPASNKWKICSNQLKLARDYGEKAKAEPFFNLFKFPVKQDDYFKWRTLNSQYFTFTGNMLYYFEGQTLDEFLEMWGEGVPTHVFKKWVLGYVS